MTPWFEHLQRRAVQRDRAIGERGVTRGNRRRDAENHIAHMIHG
jgi:hypothetical protein